MCFFKYLKISLLSGRFLLLVLMFLIASTICAVRSSSKLSIFSSIFSSATTFASAMLKVICKSIGRIGRIIFESTEVIWNVLAPEYLICPNYEEELLKIASEFEKKWQFNHYIDGKHVVMWVASNNYSRDAKAIREDFRDFFLLEMVKFPGK